MKRQACRILIVFVILSIMIPLNTMKIVKAHSITVNADLADWTMILPAQENLGIIQRNSTEQGEYVWKDASGDERTDFGSPISDVDQREFRITADENYLYLLAKMSNITHNSGDGAPMLQIAIDTNQVYASGATFFALEDDTQSILPQPGSGWSLPALAAKRQSPGCMTPTLVDQAGGNLRMPAAPFRVQTMLLIIRVSWATLGSSGVPSGPLQFTVAAYLATSNDVTWDVMFSSNILDCVTNYGDPGTAANTWAEVADGDLDYFFSVWFEHDGDPYPPLLISEFSPTHSSVIHSQSGMIYNNTSVQITIWTYKLGDSETIGDGEGMYEFPGWFIKPSEVQIVANRASSFASLFGISPDDGILDWPDDLRMEKYVLWSNGDMQIGNAGDEILLLDPHDTIIDMVVFGTGFYPGITALSYSTGDHRSIERWPVRQDTNDCIQDFRLQANPNPGIALGDLFFLPLTIKP